MASHAIMMANAFAVQTRARYRSRKVLHGSSPVFLDKLLVAQRESLLRCARTHARTVWREYERLRDNIPCPRASMLAFSCERRACCTQAAKQATQPPALSSQHHRMALTHTTPSPLLLSAILASLCQRECASKHRHDAKLWHTHAFGCLRRRRVAF